MKTTMNLMLMLVLACSMPVMAQMGSSSDSSMNQDHMAGKKMSMSGCISEKDGKYMMTNKEHPDGVRLMSSEDLKPHVGHTVKVTGMMETVQAMSNDSTKSDDKMATSDSMKRDNMGIMTMKVTSMKMVSEHCDMPMSK